MNLAKNLREAGANVWLDQLDIQAGSRWDSSIETALKSSQTLLVVLSKRSVESQNVMDEVSFALEEGKTVVPVLFESCEIPFRLRRLQFADFTGDHKKGIVTLTEALQLEQNVASKLTDATTTAESKPEPASQDPDVSQRRKEEDDLKQEAETQARKTASEAQKLEAGKERLQREASASKQAKEFASSTRQQIDTPGVKSKSKIPLIIAGVALLIAAIFVIPGNFSSSEEPLYETSVATEEPNFEETPENPEVTPVEVINTDPTADAEVPIEESEIIEEPGSQDEQDWILAESTNSVEGFVRYLKTYEEGIYADEASDRLEELLPHTGFVEYGTLSGDRLVEQYFAKVEDTESAVPQEGDIIMALTDRNVREGVIGVSQNSSRNGDVIATDQKMLVLDMIRSGNSSIWVEIAYSE